LLTIALYDLNDLIKQHNLYACRRCSLATTRC